METITSVLQSIDSAIWGIPLICLILVGGIFLTIRTHGVQFTHLPRALHYMLKNEETSQGEVSSFAALCTALSATIGTGNIVGVATAVVTGGPGAMFWMWIAALFGMATKYSEGMLAVKYRDLDTETGHTLGGPFYYIQRGLGHKWTWMAKLFAFFGVLVGLFGIGTFTQVNSISSSIVEFFDPSHSYTISLFGSSYTIATVVGSLALAIVVGLIVIGGLRRIASVAELLIPAMMVIYVGFSLLLIIFNIGDLPRAFVEIVEDAFGLNAMAGGALGSILIAMQMGIARGIFSNEAGLGSAPIAAAAAQTNEPVRQGLVSMTGTFLDTIIVCSMTGLVLVMTGAYQIPGLEGANVTVYAFQAGLPFVPPAVVSFILMVCLVLFGMTTILGWNYYSERCLEFLTHDNERVIRVFRWLYIAAVFIGPYMTVSAVWTIADICNGLMAIPNMIALLGLSGVVAAETKSYFDRLKAADGDDEKMEPFKETFKLWKYVPEGMITSEGNNEPTPSSATVIHTEKTR